MPKALSSDLRRRIIDTWLLKKHKRGEIAERFCVSLAMVKKLIAQHRRTGQIENLHHRAGRKRLIQGEDEQRLILLVREQPDATLEQLRERLGIDCTIPTIHNALSRLGESYKKKGRGGGGAKAP